MVKNLVRRFMLVSSMAIALPVTGFAQSQEEDITRTPEVITPPVQERQPDIALPQTPTSTGHIPKEAYTTFVMLKHVNFEGSSIYESAELQQLVTHNAEKEVAVAYLYELAWKVAQLYRRDGYFLSDAIVPPQKLDEGTARIQIVEGYIDSIELASELDRAENFNPNIDLLMAYSQQITMAAPIKRQVLERYLLLMNDLPGLTVTSKVKPAANRFGGAQLILNIHQDTIDGSISVNNRGSKALGNMRTVAQVNLNSIMGRSEQTSLTYSTVEPFGNGRLNFIAFEQKEYLGKSGLSAELNATWSDSLLDSDLVATNTGGETTNIGLSLSYPFVRSMNQNIYLSAGINRREAESKVIGIPTSNDTVYILSAQTRMEKKLDTSTSWSVDLGASKGLSIFDASEKGDVNLSRGDADPQFLLFHATTSMNKQLGKKLLAKLQVAGQYTSDNLLSMSEFRIGGNTIGRAYGTSALVGDKGYKAMAEISAPIFQKLGAYGYVFLDGGTVWDNAPNGSGHESAYSYGFGVRGTIKRSIWYDVTFALPSKTIGTTTEKNKPEIFFNLGHRF